MKSLLTTIIIVVFAIANISAQKTCLEMMQEGNKALEKGNYRSAILKFQAASKCDGSLQQKADKNILKAFDKIESLKQIAEKEKRISEEIIKKLSTLIGDVTEVLQRDENLSIIGIDRLKNDIFQTIIPYQDYLKVRSDDIGDKWKVARSHLQIGVSLESLGDEKFEDEYKKAFEISFESIKELTKRRRSIPEELAITVLNSAVYYSWSLMNKNMLDDAENILVETNNLFNKPDNKSHKIVYAHSKLANALSRYYQDIHEFEQAYTFSKKTVDYIELATILDEENLRYKSSHAIYLRNLDVKLDSFLTPEDRELINHGCNIAEELSKTPGSGVLALTTLAQCAHNGSYDLSKQGLYDEAIELVSEIIEQLDFYIHLDPENTSFYLHRARMNSRLADLYLSLKEPGLRLEKLLKAKEDWMSAINGKASIPNELWIVRNIYIDIRELHNIVSDSLQKIQVLSDLRGAINNSAQKNKNVFDIALIAGDIHSNFGELLNKNGHSYEEVLSYYDTAVEYFHNTNILRDIDVFTEKYSWYCQAIKRRLELNYKYKNSDLLIEDLSLINELFGPVLEKYPYDFYTRVHFWTGNRFAGDLLFEQKKYKEAMPYLNYASKWGTKESTMLLSEIYRNGLVGEKNISLADSLEILAPKQSMKKFTVPCIFGKVKAPFDLYVLEYPKDYEYQGIDDQSEWLWNARGGIVPDAVRESFKKLQVLARENDVSFPELCLYAIGAAENSDKEALEKEIASDSLTIDQKVEKYDVFFDKLRSKIVKDTSESSIDKYFEEGFEYVEYLIKVDQLDKAKSITQELIETRPDKNDTYRKLSKVHLAEYENKKAINSKVDYKRFLVSTHISALAEYYRYFLRKKKKDDARFWQSKILENSNFSSVRFVLFKNQLDSKIDLFKELYLMNNGNSIQDDIEYFIKQINKENSNELKKKYYQYLIKLEEHLTKNAPEKVLADQLGGHYNSWAWYQLLTGEFKNAEKTIKKGLKLDPTNGYFYTNLPPVYLLQGQYKKAEKLYLEWMNKPFTESDNYELYKDVFLDDFEVFQKDEIIPEKYIPDAKKIINLLND